MPTMGEETPVGRTGLVLKDKELANGEKLW